MRYGSWWVLPFGSTQSYGEMLCKFGCVLHFERQKSGGTIWVYFFCTVRISECLRGRRSCDKLNCSAMSCVYVNHMKSYVNHHSLNYKSVDQIHDFVINSIYNISWIHRTWRILFWFVRKSRVTTRWLTCTRDIAKTLDNKAVCVRSRVTRRLSTCIRANHVWFTCTRDIADSAYEFVCLIYES